MNDKQQLAEPPAKHEPNRIATTTVVSTVAGALLLVGMALALVYGVIAVLVAETPEPMASSEVQLPAALFSGPQLISDQRLQLEQLRAREDRVLQAYKWVDRDRGVAQIPIRRAMAILAERKLKPASKAAENRDAN
ncbi:MAG TPA: hypothetical protein VGJ26_19225 [Pirellulales bacterium]|jgi:hypothetical protein